MNQFITSKGENGAVKTKSDREKLDTAATGAFAGEEAAERIDSKRGFKDVMEHIMKAIFLVCGLVAIAFVLVISIYLIVSGIPAIREVGLWNFLAGSTWDPANNTTGALFGILPMILTSIYGTCGAIIIGVPIGFLMAVYLSKVANRKVSARRARRTPCREDRTDRADRANNAGWWIGRIRPIGQIMLVGR